MSLQIHYLLESYLSAETKWDARVLMTIRLMVGEDENGSVFFLKYTNNNLCNAEIELGVSEKKSRIVLMAIVKNKGT